MFAVLDTERLERLRRRDNQYTIDVVRTGGGFKHAVLRTRKASGVRAEKKYSITVNKALGELRSMGVRVAVAAKSFDGAELLPHYGIASPDQTEVFERCLSKLASRCASGLVKAAGKKGGLCIAVIARHAGVRLETLIAALMPYAGCLLIEAGRDTVPYCHLLRRDYGIAAQAMPSPERLSGADLIVCLTPWRSGLNPRPDALCLLAGGYDTEPLCRCVDGVLLPTKSDCPPPGGVDAAQWNNALFLSGACPEMPEGMLPTWRGRAVSHTGARKSVFGA